MAVDGGVSSKAVVLLSGGLDSMVCAGLARERGHDVIALTIDYGQRHRRELESARLIASKLQVFDHLEIELDLRKFGGSALTDDGLLVPKEGLQDRIPVTYVPARNLVFLSLMVACAEARGAQEVYIGVNALDYSGYPDCRPEFIEAFSRAAQLGTKKGVEDEPIRIVAPLQEMSKAQIARECARLGFDPSWSWSCYDPAPSGRACGQCDSCRLRRKGFEEAGLVDPTEYEI